MKKKKGNANTFNKTDEKLWKKKKERILLEKE